MKKKYKLIKKYPGSPELGYILEQLKNQKNQDDNYYYHGLWLNPSKYPEFWEEIVEKDYEILSFKYGNGCSYYHTLRNNNYYVQSDQSIKSSTNYTLKQQLNDLENNRCVIHSVQRLSDGEVFTIGDNTHLTGKIKYFQICRKSNLLIVGFNDGEDILEFVEHFKQPLFTTEDGVDIFEGDKYYPVGFSKEIPGSCEWYVVEGEHKYLFKYSKYIFSTKEKAEEYILMNKPCLSITDIYNLNLWSRNGTVMTAIKKLVKSKL